MLAATIYSWVSRVLDTAGSDLFFTTQQPKIPFIFQFYVILRFSAMRTITNVFILALALADIAFLVHIPLLVATSVLGKWPFGNLYCKM